MMKGVKNSPNSFLFQKVDIAPLAAFRILMGLLMASEGFGAIITGWVRRNYVDPDFSFNFIGFDFLQVLVGPQAYAVYVLLGIFGLMISFGYRYKFAAAGYGILWAAVYYGQKTSYNNHYYLLLLFCVLLLIVPAHRYRSLDAKSGRVSASEVTPYWSIWCFKFLLLVVYLYAAIAKLYPDWLQGIPVKIFLSGKADWALIGPLTNQEWFIYLIAYGGIFFDFLVIPALWYKPTRKYAFAVSIGFHLFNSIVFHIGIFPYMMLICSVLFFDPSRIRKIFFRNSVNLDEHSYSFPQREKLISYFMIAFFAMNILLPLRHFLFPGNVHWTEEGHRLAWHMMLRSKRGTVFFIVLDKEGNKIETRYPENHMSSKMARKMATRPDMIWQYSQRIQTEYQTTKNQEVEVFARSKVSLNGRPLQSLINPKVNLANEDWTYFYHHDWILPLEED